MKWILLVIPIIICGCVPYNDCSTFVEGKNYIDFKQTLEEICVDYDGNFVEINSNHHRCSVLEETLFGKKLTITEIWFDGENGCYKIR